MAPIELICIERGRQLMWYAEKSMYGYNWTFNTYETVRPSLTLIGF